MSWLNCPNCGASHTVTTSAEAGDVVKRRRKCMLCGAAFYTEERPVTDPVAVFQLSYLWAMNGNGREGAHDPSP